MFNTRRIHKATVDSGWLDIDRGTENSLTTNVYNNVERLVEGRPFKFARRAFAGATRINLTFDADAGYEEGGCFASTEPKVWLCAAKCRLLLGVGPRTKKFSLWYKVV